MAELYRRKQQEIEDAYNAEQEFLKNAENLLINGAMDYWQRRTIGNLGAGGNSDLACDRWNTYSHSTSVGTLERNTDVPPELQEKGVKYSIFYNYSNMQVDINNNNTRFGYRFNADLFNGVDGQTVTYSFYYKCNNHTSFTLNFSPYTIKDDKTSFGADIINQSIPVQADNQWHRFEYTFTLPSNISDFGGQLFTFWQPAALGAAGGIKVAGAMLHVGDKAAPFKRKAPNLPEELQLCQRYFEKSYNVDTPLGTVTTSNEGGTISLSSTDYRAVTDLKVSKRKIPVVTLYSPATGNPGVIRIYNFDSARSANAVGENSFNIVGPTSVGVRYVTYQWAADAEL